MLTGEGDKEKVNYSRKDCVMMILAMEAGLDIPEVLFEVGLVNNCEQRERVIYFCILFYTRTTTSLSQCLLLVLTLFCPGWGYLNI